jgi:hypothetical protein
MPRMYNTSLEEGREMGFSERLRRRLMVAIKWLKYESQG